MVTCIYPEPTAAHSGTFVANWAKQLIQNGSGVLVFKRDHITFGSYIKSFSRILKFYRNPRIYSYEWQGIQVVRQGIHLILPLDYSKSSPKLTYRKIKPTIIDLHKKHSFNIIYLATWGDLSLATSWIAKEINIPYIASAIGDHTTLYYDKPESIYYNFEKETYLGSKLVICVSSDMKKKVDSMAEGRANSTIFYSGVDTNVFYRSENSRINYRNRFGFSENEFVILFVGRLTERKGIYLLLKAFASLLTKKPSARLLLVGNMIEKRKFQRAMHRHGFENRIILVDGVAHNEIPGYMNAADVFVLPSLMEGLPNVVMEACSCECPVIASAVGGIPELIDDQKTGLLLKHDYSKELTAKLEFIMDNRDAAIDMGKKARQKMVQEFNFNKNGRIIYQKLLHIVNNA